MNLIEPRKMENKIKKILIGLALVIVVSAVGLYLKVESGVGTAEAKTKVTVYKSPDCGCCVQHAAYLRGLGFKVEIKNISNMSSIKKQHQISSEMESCHTEIIEGYFVEGHVPVEAINKLLEEKPDIDGISLPGMPSGSPGMPGLKLKDFVIYSITDGVFSEFMRL